MNSSFLELLREELGELLHRPRLRRRRHRPAAARLPARARAVHPLRRQDGGDRPDRRRGRSCTAATPATGSRSNADYAVMTVPFPVLRHVEVLTPFSRAKQRAIRQLHYDASAKVFLQFRRRFWEDGRRHRRRRHRHRPRGAQRVLPRPRARRPDAACCSPATRGARTRSAGDRCHRTIASCRRSRTSPGSIRRRSTSSRSARRRCGTTTSSPAAPSRCSIPSSRPCSTSAIVAARGPHPLRRRARVAVARVDPGCDRVGPARGRRDPRARRALRSSVGEARHPARERVEGVVHGERAVHGQARVRVDQPDDDRGEIDQRPEGEAGRWPSVVAPPGSRRRADAGASTRRATPRPTRPR